jgi:hypothetical protein
MAFVSFALYTEGGAPDDTATPTFSKYVDRHGTNRSAPSIANLGGGVYGFTPSAADIVAETCYLISTGKTPEYVAGSVGYYVAWGCYDGDGAPFTGAIPIFTSYDNYSGDAQAQPTLDAVGGGLYGFMPSSTDISQGRVFHVNNGSGAFPEYISGQVDSALIQSTPGATFAGVTGVPLSGSSGTPADVGRDLELDLTTRDLVLRDGDLYLVRDAASIVQDIDMRLRFWKGEWFLDPNVGVPYLEKILVKPPRLQDAEAVFRELLLAVPGVSRIIDLRVTYEGQLRNLRVRWNVATDLGELSGVSEAGV